jgi:hypothetical protein
MGPAIAHDGRARDLPVSSSLDGAAMFYLADQQIRELLDHRAATDMVDQALADLAFGSAVLHAPQHSQAHALHLHSHGAIWTTRRIATLRADAGHLEEKGLMLVFDLGASAARAVVEGTELERWALAAQSTAVTRRLLSAPPKRLLLWGADARTQAQAECMCDVMDIQHIDVLPAPGDSPLDPRWCMRLQTATRRPVRGLPASETSAALPQADVLVMARACADSGLDQVLQMSGSASSRLCILPPTAAAVAPTRGLDLTMPSLIDLYQGHAPWHAEGLTLWEPADTALAQTALAYLALQRLTTPVHACG